MQNVGPHQHLSHIKDTLAYQFLERMLPTAVVASSVAALVVFATYSEHRVALSLSAASIGLLSAVIWRGLLPRVRKACQLDSLTGMVLLAATGATVVAASTSADDSPVTGGMLVMLSAFAFVRTRNFVLFGVVTILAPFAARALSGHQISLDYVKLAILGPVFGGMARVAFVLLQIQASTARDALTRKIDQLEEERERRTQSEKQLVHAQKMEGLGLLAAGVAHDFNNHLQSIVALSETLCLEDIAASQENAGHIRQAALAASQICQRMLTYVGKTQDDCIAIDLSRVVVNLQPMLIAAAGGNHRIRFEHGAGSIFIRGNESALQQCLMNLVHNALDATRDRNGEIDVRTGYATIDDDEQTEWRVFGDPAAGNYGMVEVTDNGEGMAPRTLERAFDPYFTTKKTGNGFGLATTLGIVCGYGGGIRCLTEPESGTRIQLLFPMTAAVAPETNNCRQPEWTSDSRILLVDDEQLVRSAVTRLLQGAGYAVTAVASAAAAVERVQRTPTEFDVVLIDYAMPDMNGLQLLVNLREIGFRGRAILCSGYADVELGVSERVELDGVLTKPYRLADLEEVLCPATE